MEDVVRVPVVLIDADLDEVAGGSHSGPGGGGPGGGGSGIPNINVLFGNGNLVGNDVTQENVNASGNNFGIVF